MVGAAGAAEARARLAAADWLDAQGPYECFGQWWSLHTTDRAFAEMLDGLYAPMRRAGPPPSAAHVRYRLLPAHDDSPGVLERNGKVTGARDSPTRLLGHLVWSINRQVIDRSLDRLILHAAAVSVRGRVVVLPAAMESGKTTLATGLLDRGAAYLTDEAAAIDDATLTVEGFPKPLSIDRGSWHVLAHHEPNLPSDLAVYHQGQWQVQPASFAAVEPQGSLGVFVFPAFERGARTRIEPLRPVDALEHAMACTFGPPRSLVPPAKVRQLAVVLGDVPAFRLVTGDLDRACQLVMGVVDELPEPGEQPAVPADSDGESVDVHEEGEHQG